MKKDQILLYHKDVEFPRCRPEPCLAAPCTWRWGASERLGHVNATDPERDQSRGPLPEPGR